MRTKKLFKRLLATAIATVLMVNSVPTDAFATDGQNSFSVDVKRNEDIAFSVITDALVPSNDQSTVSVRVEEGEYSTEVSATVAPVYYVNGTCSKDTDKVSFAASGDYTLVKGVGTVSGVMNENAKAAYDALVTAANTADAEVTAAQEAAKEPNTAWAAAAASLAAAGLSKAAAENAYNEAVAEQAEAQTAYETAVAALNNVAAAIQAKQAELAAEQEELKAKQAELAEAQTKLAAWKTENGYNSQEAIQDAIDAKQAVIDAKQKELDGLKWWEALSSPLSGEIASLTLELTALKALPAILEGLENTLAKKQAEVAAQEAEVASAQETLNEMNEEEKRALLQRDIDNAKAVLETANATVTEKETAKAEAEVAYNEAAEAEASAKTAAEAANAAVSEKETAAENAWAAVGSFVNALDADDVVFNYAHINWEKGSESFGFEVDVYDEITVYVSGPNGAGIKVDDSALAGDTFKLYDGKSAVLTFEEIKDYRYAVNGTICEENTYVAGPVTGDTVFAVQYVNNGEAAIYTETSETVESVVVKANGTEVSGSAVNGTVLTVEATPKAGYAVENYMVNGSPIEGNTFTVDASEISYTVSASTVFVGSIVDFAADTLSENVSRVDFTIIDGETENSYEPGTMIPSGGKTIVVKPEVKAITAHAVAVHSINVIVVEGDGSDLDVRGYEDGTFRFTAKSGCKYVVEITDANVTVSSLSSSIEFGDISNATVRVEIGNNTDAYGYESGQEEYTIENVAPGTPVKVIVWPMENHYITNAVVKSADTVIAAGTLTENAAINRNGEFAFSFTTAAAATNYVINVETDTPIVAPNDKEVKINKYELIDCAYEEVEGKLASGFDSVESSQPLSFEYKMGTIVVPEIDLFVTKIPGFTYDVWAGLYQEVVTADEIAGKITDELTSAYPSLANVINKNIVSELLGDVENYFESFHKFGTQEVETVRAIYYGTGIYQDTTSEPRNVVVSDERIEVDVEINDEISVVYGSYTDNHDLILKLLEGQRGVVANGEELEQYYDDQLMLDCDLVGTGVGTYTVEVGLSDTDYKYKDYEKVTATIEITKADVEVAATEENIVLYENVGTLSKDALVQITPYVEIEDQVSHMSFLMGFDANLNEDAKPAIFATVDLSTTQLNLDIFGINTADEFIRFIDSDGDGLTLEELLNKADDIKNMLALAGVNADMAEDYVNVEALKDTLKALYGALDKYSEYGDIYVKFANDPSAVVPDSHGIYVVGAVTADANYNTAADAAVIVVTAEPVLVKFDDANDNNMCQFTYDGTAKVMSAAAYGNNGDVLEGTMKYLYVGAQTDGTPYFSAEAPVHAGAYTVAAVFSDAGYHKAGFATGALVILPSDEVDVVVENKVVVYNAENPETVDVMGMITVTPAEADAKIAVVTAGIDLYGDFGKNEYTSINGIVNIDFPAKADEVLKKIVPSAYAEGVSLETVNNKLAEIKTQLAKYDIEADVIDKVMAAVEAIPNVTRLTFKEQSEIQPVNLGAYLVAAVVFDPDYMPKADCALLAIVPGTVSVDFEPDENVDNVRRFTYTGEAIEMPVSVKYADGSKAKAENLTIVYKGVDVNGDAYESTEAPVNTGIYMVTATYAERSAGKLAFAGMNVGVMSIEPAEAVITAKDVAVEYDGEGHMVEIENEKGLNLIKVVVDDKGNANIILPERFGVETATVNTADAAAEIKAIIESSDVDVHAAAEKIVNRILAELDKVDVEKITVFGKEIDVEAFVSDMKAAVKKAGNAIAECDVDAVTEKIVEALENVEAKDITVNGSEPTEDGVYTVTVIGFAKNYKAAAAQAMIDIHKHTEGETVVENEIKATCTEGGSYENAVYCTECEKELSRETVTVSALGHTEAVDAAVAATCTETGLTEGKHCSVCSEVLTAQTVVDALGHTEVVDAAVAPTYDTTGLTEGKHCSVCGTVTVAQTVVDKLTRPSDEGSSGGSSSEKEESKEEDKPVEVYPAVPTTPAAPETSTTPEVSTTPETPAAPAVPNEPAAPETPAETEAPAMPEKADTTIVTVTASEEVIEAVKETVTVSEAVAVVDKEAVEAIIEATAKEETVIVIPLAQITEEEVHEVKVDAEALATVVELGKDIVIELTGITVKLDAKALEAVIEQAKGAEIEIRAVVVESVTLTDAQQNVLDQLDTAIIVTAQIFSDGEYIGEFNGGTATVMLPFVPEEDKAVEDYKVYYIDEAGELQAVAAEYVDGYMVFSTSHFSDYVIVYEGVTANAVAVPETEEILEVKSSFPWWCLAIIPVAAVLVVICTRRKSEE